MAERCIRLAETADTESMLSIYRPVVLNAAISFEETPPGPQEFRDRVLAISKRFPWLVCARGGDVVGYAYASTFSARAAYQWTVETTVYVADRARRQGVGRALYTSLLACLTLQGHAAAIAVIALPNAGSVGLHETMGFEACGVLPRAGFKHGAWHDIGYWRRVLTDTERPSAPTLPSEHADSRPWTDAIRSGETFLQD